MQQASALNDMPLTNHTLWLAVFSVFLAGLIGALHVGKATIALPMLQLEFNTSLAAISWVISIFPIIGVFAAIPASSLIQKRGDKHILLIGLLILAGAAITGSFAQQLSLLLFSRFIEGLGFLLILVAAPVILNRVAAAQQRNLVFSLWSTFMPSGMALSLLIGPLLSGWRMSWLIGGILALTAIVLINFSVASQKSVSIVRPPTILQALNMVIKAKLPLLLALIFTSYSIQFFIVMSFLPIFLIERLGLSLQAAGTTSAAVIAASMLGNMAAGVLLSKGITARDLLVSASMLMGLAGIGIFWQATPDKMMLALCFLFTLSGGLIPATIMATTPHIALSPAVIPLCLSLAMQGSYLGQVIGPVAVGSVVAYAGWHAAMSLILIVAIIAVTLGFLFKQPTAAQSRMVLNEH